MSDITIIRTACPRCEGQRSCDLLHALAEESEDFDNLEHPMFGGAEHQLLRCRGCETVFYKVESWHSEDWDVRFNRQSGEDEMYYPKTVSVYPPPEPKSQRPDWAWDLRLRDNVLAQIVEEMYVAKTNQLNVLTAVGLRSALDRATFILGIDEGLDFPSKIAKLTDDGRLGKVEADQLQVLVQAGNAAAHRGWSPDDAQLSALLDVLERFIRSSFFSPPVEKIGALIPPRPKRQPKQPSSQ